MNEAEKQYILGAFERAKSDAFERGQLRQTIKNLNVSYKNLERQKLENNQHTDVSVGLARIGSGPRASRRDPQGIGNLVTRLTKYRQWDQEISSAAVVTRWIEIVGPQVAQHCRISAFGEGIVEVECSSTAWQQQFKLLLPTVERRISEEVGANVVKRIRVKGPNVPSWKHGKFSVRGRGPRDTYG